MLRKLGDQGAQIKNLALISSSRNVHFEINIHSPPLNTEWFIFRESKDYHILVKFFQNLSTFC